MSSTTGLLFSYALGLIFVVGGIVFMVLLDERRFLFGIPYLIIGLLLIGGVRASQRRRGARAAQEEAERGHGPDPGPGTPPA